MNAGLVKEVLGGLGMKRDVEPKLKRLAMGQLNVRELRQFIARKMKE